MSPGEVIRVGVNGAKGRMGRTVLDGLQKEDDMRTVFVADKGDDLPAAIKESKADVVIDFTVPDVVFEQTMKIIDAGARPVVGTTGLSPGELERIDHALRAAGLGGIVAPNFSMGALVMMRLCEIAAKSMRSCEIVEIHHEKKLDSPSGTSLLTAERIERNLGLDDGAVAENAVSTNPPGSAEEGRSRGLKKGPVTIHSVRLPGVTASQQVLFGGDGETLTITHDVQSRASFVPGVMRAVRQVMTVTGLQVGLEI